MNDAFGPVRDRAEQQKLKAVLPRQNVAFVYIKDGSGFPHIFWMCICDIEAGETLWGDYGDGYWKNKQDEDPIFSAMLRRMLHTLRGCSGAFPIPVECEVHF